MTNYFLKPIHISIFSKRLLRKHFLCSMPQKPWLPLWKWKSHTRVPRSVISIANRSLIKFILFPVIPLFLFVSFQRSTSFLSLYLHGHIGKSHCVIDTDTSFSAPLSFFELTISNGHPTSKERYIILQPFVCVSHRSTELFLVVSRIPLFLLLLLLLLSRSYRTTTSYQAKKIWRGKRWKTIEKSTWK